MTTTGNDHKYTGNYSHCPPDVIKAIADYEARIKAGIIAYANPDSILATDYPGQAESEKSLDQFITDQIGDGV